MNIGIVTTWFERGAAYVSRQYMDVLAPAHQVFIYCRDGERMAKGDLAWDENFVTWGKQPLVDDPSAVDLKDFDRWLTQRKIDCVLFNEQRNWAPVVLCAQRKIRTGAYVVHYREDTVPFFDCHDFVICNSQHHFDVFRNHAQAWFVRWGTDLDQFHPAAEGFAHPGRLTFFHSGGMNPRRKGTDLVLEAFRHVRPGKLPAHLILHTQTAFHQSLPEVFSNLEAAQQPGNITVIDKTVSDPAALYRLGDVCVYPTRHEGLGLTVAESLASGLPILVTDQAPVTEHADGCVVRPIAVVRRLARPDGDYWPQSLASVEALVDQMQVFVDFPERVPELKRRAREKAEELLDWTANARDLPQFFAHLKLVDSPRKSAALAAAREYERGKWKLGFRNWVGYNYPWLVRLVRVAGNTSKSGR